MRYNPSITTEDSVLAARLHDFIPEEVYDIHVHAYDPSHFASGTWEFLKDAGVLGPAEHQRVLQRYMPSRTVHGLYFGLPHPTADRQAMNAWTAAQVSEHATPLSRTLLVSAPQDSPVQVAAALRSGRFTGIKVYHCYAPRPDTMQARITEYAPEWMWELLHEVRGVMLLHMVREGAIDDAVNQQEIRRLCRSYPQVRLILAHVARSFNYRNARSGLYTVADLDNVVIDTSAITESESFTAALKMLGPGRVLWGSDYPVSEMRGRCVTVGAHFFWLHPEVLRPGHQPPTRQEMTLVGIESLLTLREACEDAGLTRAEIAGIFRGNALRLLEHHLPAEAVPEPENGNALWQQARTVISGGTGLLSKRAEMFDDQEWPAYFSRSAGCEVWDLAGRRYVDFAGGIGAVLLGYSDPDVNAAVYRRLSQGTYASLVNPQEVELAVNLLALHPWAGKVRYARGGGEAMAMAVRIARAFTGKSGIAFCGYHGWHDWYLAANLGETNALDGHLLPGLEPSGVPRELLGTSVPFHYNDLDSLDAALQKLGNNLAGVIMEPMRAQFPCDGFLEKVAERCRASGGVLVVDEITSGLRYGFPGASAKLGIEPDIVVYAKAMGNGLPFAAVMGREDVMRAADASFISSSYWTDGVGTAAALAVLEKMERMDVYPEVWSTGESFQKQLSQVAARYPACQVQVGGMPSTPTLTFGPGVRPLYVRKMLKSGFLASGVFYLMLAHQAHHLAAFLDAFDKTLDEIAKQVQAGNLTVPEENQRPPGFTRLA